MSQEQNNILRLEGFFAGVAGTASFAILASTISGREPDVFVFSVMPWVSLAGGLGWLVTSRMQRRLKRDEDNG